MEWKMTEEETIDLKLYKWEVTDLIGILKRHQEKIENELEKSEDQGEEWMLRTQKRKTDNLLDKVSKIYEEKENKK